MLRLSIFSPDIEKKHAQQTSVEVISVSPGGKDSQCRHAVPIMGSRKIFVKMLGEGDVLGGLVPCRPELYLPFSLIPPCSFILRYSKRINILLVLLALSLSYLL